MKNQLGKNKINAKSQKKIE